MAARTHNKMFAQWWGSVQAQSAIFVQRLVTWDSEAFQNPTTAQTQTLCLIYQERLPLIKRLTFVLTLITSTVTVWGQVTVTGTVVSKDDNSAIPQANVVEKGTQNGTATNSDGTFSLNVKNPNAILVFSFIGFVAQEYSLNGKQQVFIKLKSDCNKDFFDSQQIILFAKSGLINNPVGGQIDFASPWLYRGVLKGSYSYQTNLKENEFQNAQIELSHYVSNCDFDMDFRWNYRQVSLSNDLDSKAYSLETDLNIRNIKLIAGYSHLDFRRMETGDNETLSGVLIGFGTYLNIPLHPTLTGKVSLYNNRAEYQASIQGGHKWFQCFIKYYKLNSFNELSLGIGTRIGYRLKRQRR